MVAASSGFMPLLNRSIASIDPTIDQRQMVAKSVNPSLEACEFGVALRRDMNDISVGIIALPLEICADIADAAFLRMRALVRAGDGCFLRK